MRSTSRAMRSIGCRKIPQTVPHSRLSRVLRLPIQQKLILRPSGDNQTSHVGDMEAPTQEDIELKSGVFEVGREKPADIVIPVPTVSARHALLRISEKEVTVTDLESTNGTYIARQELQPMQAIALEIGNEVIFGDEHLANFILMDAPDVEIVEAEAEKLS